jgi:hypothetical protein
MLIRLPRKRYPDKQNASRKFGKFSPTKVNIEEMMLKPAPPRRGTPAEDKYIHIETILGDLQGNEH